MQLTKPTLLVDKEKCISNIKRMAHKANLAKAVLRPHFKTHHSLEVASWFREQGVTSCTVSSVSMAKYFADGGWENITIAFPYNPLESEEISAIAQKTSLNILIESAEGLQLANDNLTEPVGYFIKIDIGTHRTGIDPNNVALIEELVNGSTERVNYKGFLAHAGHTYSCSDRKSIENIYHDSISTLTDLKSKYGGIISYGDTPSCSVVDDLSAVDEIRAGNYVFFDWMQVGIGSCSLEDISVCLASPVVAVHDDRNELVVHGGAVHLSKETVMEDGRKCYGKVVSLSKKGWNYQVIGDMVGLSQEHGIVKMSADHLAHVKIGDLIGIIPIHSCLAADLQGHYCSTEGQKIEKIVKE